MNAKQEYLNHIKDRKVKAIKIARQIDYARSIEITKPSALNFEYDPGFGCQELYGYIWYEDGTWSEREEYDGSEWWVHKQCPPLDVEIL